jgi:hypothetical protein
MQARKENRPHASQGGPPPGAPALTGSVGSSIGVSSSAGDNDSSSSSSSSSAESPLTTLTSVRRKARRALREREGAAVPAPTPPRAYGRSPRLRAPRATLAAAPPAFDELVHRPRQMRFYSFVRVVSFVADEPVRRPGSPFPPAYLHAASRGLSY